MFCCYVIYSPATDKFYVGETKDFPIRLRLHNTATFKNASTKFTNDWEEFLIIPCRDRSQARKTEAFIKKQKSKKFIRKLKENPDMVNHIKNKY